MTIIPDVSNTAIVMFSGQTILVTASGRIETYGMTLTQGYVDTAGSGTVRMAVTVLGTVSSTNSNAINMNLYGTTIDAINTVVIGTTGVVTAGYDYATIALAGVGNVFSNMGTVLGGGGVWGVGWTGGHFDNSGTINGVKFAAVHLESGSSTQVNNSGTLNGVSGVEMIGATADITNAGLILSSNLGRAAVDGLNASAAFSLYNTGTVQGPLTAILGSGFNDGIVSSGTIRGTVRLGDGLDYFDGRGGVTLGPIYGGRGDDRIYSGRGDDKVLGDAGRDTLAGNQGDDTLTGGTERDTFVFARHGGDDVVTDFSHGLDKLDLTAFHLTGFAALTLVAHAGGLEIDLTGHGGGTIELAGLTLALLTASDVML